jgi:hypothetical protein
MNNDIKEELKKILGDDAISLGNMQVSDRVQKLVKSVNYLVGQLHITGDMVEDDGNRKEVKSHINEVICNTKNMLS